MSRKTGSLNLMTKLRQQEPSEIQKLRDQNATLRTCLSEVEASLKAALEVIGTRQQKVEQLEADAAVMREALIICDEIAAGKRCSIKRSVVTNALATDAGWLLLDRLQEAYKLLIEVGNDHQRRINNAWLEKRAEFLKDAIFLRVPEQF